MLLLDASIFQASHHPCAGIEAAILRNPFPEAQVREHHLCSAGQRLTVACVLVVEYEVIVLLVRLDNPVDHHVQLAVLVRRQRRVDEAHVYRGQTAITDDLDDRVWVVRLIACRLPAA